MDANALSSYYAALGQQGFLAGWARGEAPVPAEPKPGLIPAVWRFAEARQALEASLSFVTPEQAERRNLIMVNPAEGNRYATTRNIVAAYQMIGPGERLPSHRHTPSAICLAVDTRPGAYTTVEGMRLDMVNGDVVLTPNGRWHGHGNDGGTPGYWITFLDVPLLQHMEAMFFEAHPDRFETIAGRPAASPFRIRSGEVLADHPECERVTIAAGEIPAIGLELLRLGSQARSARPRSTASSLYALIAGAVRITQGVWEATLSPGDLVAMPAWRAHALEAGEETVLLRVTDEPLLATLGYLRTAAD